MTLERDDFRELEERYGIPSPDKGLLASWLTRDVIPRPQGSRSTPLGAKVCFIAASLQAIFIWGNKEDVAWYLHFDWGITFVVDHQWMLGLPIMLVGGALGFLGQRLKREFELSNVVPSRERLAEEIAGTALRGEALERDYALFLRPFSSDGELSITNPRRTFAVPLMQGYYTQPLQVDLESLLADALWHKYPMIAVGGYDGVVGAGRVTSQDWKKLVLALCENAQMILFVPSDSPGCEWEVKTILDSHWHDKTAFIMPPAVEEDRWAATQKTWLAKGVEIPDWHPIGEVFNLNLEARVVCGVRLESKVLRNLGKTLWSLAGAT